MGIFDRISSKNGHENLRPLNVGSHANRAYIKYEKLKIKLLEEGLFSDKYKKAFPSILKKL